MAPTEESEDSTRGPGQTVRKLSVASILLGVFCEHCEALHQQGSASHAGESPEKFRGRSSEPAGSQKGVGRQVTGTTRNIHRLGIFCEYFETFRHRNRTAAVSRVMFGGKSSESTTPTYQHRNEVVTIIFEENVQMPELQRIPKRCSEENPPNPRRQRTTTGMNSSPSSLMKTNRCQSCRAYPRDVQRNPPKPRRQRTTTGMSSSPSSMMKTCMADTLNTDTTQKTTFNHSGESTSQSSVKETRRTYDLE